MTQKAKADKVKSFSEKAFQRPFEDLFSCADTCAVILAIGKYVQKVHLKVWEFLFIVQRHNSEWPIWDFVAG